MLYTKKTYTDGDVLYAADMNNLVEGVEEAKGAAKNVVSTAATQPTDENNILWITEEDEDFVITEKAEYDAMMEEVREIKEAVGVTGDLSEAINGIMTQSQTIKTEAQETLAAVQNAQQAIATAAASAMDYGTDASLSIEGMPADAKAVGDIKGDLIKVNEFSDSLYVETSIKTTAGTANAKGKITSVGAVSAVNNNSISKVDIASVNGIDVSSIVGSLDGFGYGYSEQYHNKVELISGKYIQSCFVYVLDGSQDENWFVNSSYKNKRFYFRPGQNTEWTGRVPLGIYTSSSYTSTCISNYTILSANGAGTTTSFPAVGLWEDGAPVVALGTDITTVELAREYLSRNPLYLLYVLKTPIETSVQNVIIEVDGDFTVKSSSGGNTTGNCVVYVAESSRDTLDTIKRTVDIIHGTPTVLGSSGIYVGAWTGNNTVGSESRRLRYGTVDDRPVITNAGLLTGDTKGRYIDVQIYTESGEKTLDTGWVKGIVNINLPAGYFQLQIANGETYVTSTGMVKSDYNCELILFSNHKKQIPNGLVTEEDAVANGFNAWCVSDSDISDTCKRFSNLMYGESKTGSDVSVETESFMFFTDPHTKHVSERWSAKHNEYLAQIQKYYNSTPTSFVLCGGDWLGNSDTPDTACYKLGLINGQLNSMFDKCYSLVGNHDTNYQGKLTPESDNYTTRLTTNSLVNLLYRDFGKTYYSFDGSNTKFYCFDTGIENQSLTAMSGLGNEECEWFAESLHNGKDKHIALAMHMFINGQTITESNVQPIAKLISQIAVAYNNRTSVAVNGKSYNYSTSTGRIEFIIAGHTHIDLSTVYNGIPVIITKDCGSNATYPKDASFDLVYADYTSKKIHMVRAGTGEDRVVSY